MISMQPLPRERQLVITELVCSLHEGQDAHDHNQVGPTFTRSFLPELHAISVENNANTCKFELRFGLTPALLDHLDAIRQSSPNGNVRLLVRSKVTVSLVYQIAGEATNLPIVRPIPDFPFGVDCGIASTLAHFWSSSISPFAIEIPRSTWVDQVLPGVGTQHVRLLEVGLPESAGTLSIDAVHSFDAARSDLDNGRGRECVQKLRDVRYALEQQLGASKADPVAMKIAAHRGLKPDAPQVRYVDALWRALADLTSDSHHDTSPVPAMDARSALLFTAVLLDYVRAQLQM